MLETGFHRWNNGLIGEIDAEEGRPNLDAQLTKTRAQRHRVDIES